MKDFALTISAEAEKGFYPTPPDVADKLLDGIDWYMVRDVLEPSAGSGNLVRSALKKYRIEPCIIAGSPVGGTVLDPFVGSGTTGVAAVSHGRNFVGIDINAEYCEISSERLKKLKQKE